jgi:hypothetical protein
MERHPGKEGILSTKCGTIMHSGQESGLISFSNSELKSLQVMGLPPFKITSFPQNDRGGNCHTETLARKTWKRLLKCNFFLILELDIPVTPAAQEAEIGGF